MSSQIFLCKAQESILFARNSLTDEEKCHEVKFFQKSSSETNIKVSINTFLPKKINSIQKNNFQTDGGLETSISQKFDCILQKLAEHSFGGDFGANENNVALGVSWASKEATNYNLKPTDIVR